MPIGVASIGEDTVGVIDDEIGSTEVGIVVVLASGVVAEVVLSLIVVLCYEAAWGLFLALVGCLREWVDKTKIRKINVSLDIEFDSIWWW